ncbi:hypothetical protein BDB01DRAFT_835498 [Pilobolus umbonatus]|nr:hypothetical protein BDB01DRAFT_835498 [Pilobolus umbonatus]
MTSVKSRVDILTQEWVTKLRFENKLDCNEQLTIGCYALVTIVNLQMPVDNESTKIEVGEYTLDHLPKLEFSPSPSTSKTKNNDSYLQSILTSSTPPTKINETSSCTNTANCTCYKCLRQRRRANIGRGAAKSPTLSFSTPAQTTQAPPIQHIQTSPAQTIQTPAQLPPQTSSPTYTTPIQTLQTIQSGNQDILRLHQISRSSSTSSTPDNTSPATNVSPKRSLTVRKIPTLKAYEKYIPRPVYSQKDSIYRLDEATQNEEREINRINNTQSPSEKETDDYTISWKEDETGDDLLTSLKTFHTIFEEKGNDNEGLSDLLEQKARELKDQTLRKQEEVKRVSIQSVLPPPQPDCLTLSYRHGRSHNSLTLYHTMKMPNEKQRIQAYSMAFEHCINADSGLRDFVKRERTSPSRESSKLMQTVRKSTIKRSLLHPLSTKRNKAGDDLIFWASSDNVGSIPLQRTSVDTTSSAVQNISPSDNQPTDVLSAAQALLPDQSNANFTYNSTNTSKYPYEHIDYPSKPRTGADAKDTSSISSNESVGVPAPKVKRSRTGRLFSLGRKTSVRSNNTITKAGSVFSLEKVDSRMEDRREKVLDDLCKILPHIDRSELAPYVDEANHDYMTALQLCKAAVIAGKLA